MLADRLSASGRDRVLVIEAGGSDNRFWIKTPIGYGRTFADPTVNWQYQALASPGLNGRGMYWPRGRVVGGSSSINALVYCRGAPQDFDDWRQLGNVGWGWDDVKPYFERSERRIDPEGHAQGAGPLDVADVTPFLHPMRRNWLEAAAELNLPVTDDFNGEHPLGLGCYQVTIRNGVRRSAADAFLRPALRRANVKLETEAWVSRIRFAQRRAQGVEFVRAGQTQFAQAKREVLLCAGTVNSPQLLQLSGIGPAAALAALGIASVLDNPSVGGNLQDHLAVVYSYRATQPTLNDELSSAAGKLIAGIAQWHGNHKRRAVVGSHRQRIAAKLHHVELLRLHASYKGALQGFGYKGILLRAKISLRRARAFARAAHCREVNKSSAVAVDEILQ